MYFHSNPSLPLRESNSMFKQICISKDSCYCLDEWRWICQSILLIRLYIVWFLMKIWVPYDLKTIVPWIDTIVSRWTMLVIWACIIPLRLLWLSWELIQIVVLFVLWCSYDCLGYELCLVVVFVCMICVALMHSLVSMM